MPDPDIERARQFLRDGKPASALDALRGRGREAAAEVHWMRACASASLGHPVAVRIALRDLAQAGAHPSGAEADMGRVLAEAVLGQVQPCVHAAGLLAASLDRPDAATPDLCAYNTLVQHSDGRATDILLMAALARRLGQTEQATTLARGAQDRARTDGAADTLAAATWLLAALCRADGDPALAEEVLDNGARWVERLQPGAGDAYLADARQLVEAWAQPGS